MSLHELAKNLPDDCAYCRDPFDPPGQCSAWRASSASQECIGNFALIGILMERTHYLCPSCDSAMDALFALRNPQP